MFTGLIEAVGHVSSLKQTVSGYRLRVRTALAPELTIGESLAVNGVGGLGVRRVNQAEDLPRFLVHPVAQVADSVRCLGGQVGLVGAGGVGLRYPSLDVVDVHEQCHLLVPLGYERGA